MNGRTSATDADESVFGASPATGVQTAMAVAAACANAHRISTPAGGNAAVRNRVAGLARMGRFRMDNAAMNTRRANPS